MQKTDVRSSSSLKQIARSVSSVKSSNSEPRSVSNILPKIDPKQNLKRSASSSNVKKSKKQPDDNQLRRQQFKAESLVELDKVSKYARTIYKYNNPIRLFDQVPQSHQAPLHIVNQDEVKKKFLQSQIPPVLKFRVENDVAARIVSKHGAPGFTYFFKAKNILDFVKAKFPSGLADDYFEANFGPRMNNKEVIEFIGEYLKANKIQGDITVNFAPGQTCSGRLQTYTLNKNEPETRRWAVWLNSGEENQYLRKKGLGCLLDHELGTHYYRSYNDGLQPWYSRRKKHGLRSVNSNELLKTEEGIACIHTLVNANIKFLFLPALLYYLACMGETMTFQQLYSHMETYVKDPNERWKLVTRVKRGISDPNTVGSYARDQSYFEGACQILENYETIDFKLLMSGKICLDELEICAPKANLEDIKLPKFFKNMKKYKEKIRHIAIVNGLIEDKPNDSSLGKNIDELKTNNADGKIPEEENECEVIDFHTNRLDFKKLYIIQTKFLDLDTETVRKYIRNELISGTKNMSRKPEDLVDLKVQKSIVDHSLCMIL